MGHPVYSSRSKGSGWTDPSSEGFVSPIERDKIDAGRSPHFKRRGGLPRADLLHSRMSSQFSFGRCKELGTIAWVRPSFVVSGPGSILGLSVWDVVGSATGTGLSSGTSVFPLCHSISDVCSSLPSLTDATALVNNIIK